MALLHNRKQVETFVWVIALSLGFYGAKGGLFTFRTGGGGRVEGPGGSFIAGNTELGLALVMVLPLMYYGFATCQNKAARFGFGILMTLTGAAALGTQSRGAMLGIAATVVFLWLKNPNKARNGIILAIVGLALVAFMPTSWSDRMASIENYQQDGSAQGRINAWIMAWNLAVDRPIGGGFEVITPDLFQRYAPNPLDLHAAHSIYFQVLGEHGFPGIFLFVLLWIVGWRTAKRIITHSRRFEDLQWAGRLAAMVQVSFIGYVVGGAFLSLAYFDLPYDLLVILVVLNRMVDARASAMTESDSKEVVGHRSFAQPIGGSSAAHTIRS
jgi:probable O-glycosylation ligase (exosortase A-associated)